MALKKSFLTEVMVESEIAGFDTTYFNDPLCGEYKITDLAQLALDDLDTRIKIAHVLATRRVRKRPPVLITSKPIPQDERSRYVAAPFDDLLASYPRNALRMIDESLVNLSLQVTHPTEGLEINDAFSWAIFCYDEPSTTGFLRMLTELGYVFIQEAESHDEAAKLYITAKGWEKVETLSVGAAPAQDQAFVAMWFDPSREPFYKDAIVPSVETDGTSCVRIDAKHHNNKICDEIVAEIRRSRYIIADFTGNRGGVYFEAGFAQGIGKPVIWLVDKADLGNVHFDTRQYNHITYTDVADLKAQLTARIAATVPRPRS